MAGRTADISTSSFKPLSLDEIMMVPLTKQKQEDQLLASADKFSELKADVLSQDSAEAEKLISDYKSKASSLADEVISKGVDRSQFHKLRELRSNLSKEYSTGFLGAAGLNKKSAQEYLKRMKTNDGRQGWSAKEADFFANKQVQGFKTTNEDGSFNTFSGRELSKWQDEDKFISDAADMVKGKIEESSYQTLKIGGLPKFYDAVRNKKVSGADFNTVMFSIKNATETSPEMMAHIKQRAEFTGEEDPMDFGRFGDVETRLPDGTTEKSYSYIPGKSRYGRKMYGTGLAKTSKSLSISDKFIKNDIKFNMWKNNFDESQLVKMYKIQKGEYLDLKPKDIPDIRKMNDSLKVGIDQYESDIKKLESKLLSENVSPENIKSHPKYLEMIDQYTEAKTDYTNSNKYLNQLEEESFSRLDEQSQSLIMARKVYDKYDGDPVRAVMSEYGVSIEKLIEGYNFPDSKLGDKRKANMLRMRSEMYLAKQSGAKISSSLSWYNFESFYENAKEELDDLISEDLDANKKGISYKKVNMPKSGKYSSSKYRTFTDLSEEYMNPKNIRVLGMDNTTLSDYMASEEFLETIGGAAIAKDGFEFKKSFTIDGYDSEGMSYDEVIIRSKTDQTKQVVIQVPSEDYGIKKELYESLLTSGDFKQKLEGKKGLANQMFMSSIKKSNMRYQDEGNLYVELPGFGENNEGIKTDEVSFKRIKNENGSIEFQVSLFGEPVDYEGRFNLEGEQVVALALKEKYDEILKEMSNIEQDENND